MTRHSTRAFSLFEAICMIVTLFVFGWLCVGIIRDEFKQGGKDLHADIQFTTTSAEDAPKPETPLATPAPDVKPALPWKKIDPGTPTPPTGSPAPRSSSAGSPAPRSSSAGSPAPIPVPVPAKP